MTRVFSLVLNFQLQFPVICRQPSEHFRRQMDVNEGARNVNNIYTTVIIIFIN